MPRYSYIYGLRCPVDDKVHYVGRSNMPVNRFKQRLYPSSVGTKDKQDWIAGLRKGGMTPELIILETITWHKVEGRPGYWETEVDPSDVERQWVIRLHRGGHPLAQKIPKTPNGETDEEILANVEPRELVKRNGDAS